MINVRVMVLRILRPDWFAPRDVPRSSARRPTLRIATTSSAHDSGVLAELVRAFSRNVPCRPIILTVGSGRALELLERAEADIGLTHAPRHELEALRRGRIAAPIPVMTNRYTIVGPPDALHVVREATSAADALRRIACSGHRFVSRADDSGTHERERELWTEAGLPPQGGPFVIFARAGMAAALRIASERGAFTLCDRSTFLKVRHELRLSPAYEGSADLTNTYSAVLPAHRETGAALEFAGYLRSVEARRVIERCRSAEGERLYLVPALGPAGC
jgi:tungstate transport system substrate-binding protein